MFWNRKKALAAQVEADKAKDISEPVVTLLRLMESEPERFWCHAIVHDGVGYFCACILDEKTGELFNVSRSGGVDWMTDDEKYALACAARGHKRSIVNTERQRLTNIYCGEQA